jgi:hypothetical protein
MRGEHCASQPANNKHIMENAMEKTNMCVPESQQMNQNSDSATIVCNAVPEEIQQFVITAKEMNTKIHQAICTVMKFYNRSTVSSMSEQEKSQVQENITALDRALADIEGTVNDFRWWLKNRVF